MSDQYPIRQSPALTQRRGGARSSGHYEDACFGAPRPPLGERPEYSALPMAANSGNIYAGNQEKQERFTTSAQYTSISQPFAASVPGQRCPPAVPSQSANTFNEDSAAQPRRFDSSLTYNHLPDQPLRRNFSAAAVPPAATPGSIGGLAGSMGGGGLTGSMGGLAGTMGGGLAGSMGGLTGSIGDQPAYIGAQPAYIGAQSAYIGGQGSSIGGQATSIGGQPAYIGRQPGYKSGQQAYKGGQPAYVGSQAAYGGGQLGSVGGAGNLPASGGRPSPPTPAPLKNPFGTDQPAECAAAVENEEEEKPLLEELGIVPIDIARRLFCVLTFKKMPQQLLDSIDMVCPVLLLITLAIMHLIAGKLHFEYVYALMTGGTLGLWILFNLMATKKFISMHRTMSVLGYSLVPIVTLSVTAPFITLRSVSGAVISGFAILWATATASRFLEEALELQKQRYLAAYPILLFYAGFTLITVL